MQNPAGTKKKLVVKVTGAVGYTLNEPSQGDVGVRLDTGEDAHCADLGVSGQDLPVPGPGGYKRRVDAYHAPEPAGVLLAPMGAPAGRAAVLADVGRRELPELPSSRKASGVGEGKRSGYPDHRG